MYWVWQIESDKQKLTMSTSHTQRPFLRAQMSLGHQLGCFERGQSKFLTSWRKDRVMEFFWKLILTIIHNALSSDGNWDSSKYLYFDCLSCLISSSSDSYNCYLQVFLTQYFVFDRWNYLFLARKYIKINSHQKHMWYFAWANLQRFLEEWTMMLKHSFCSF